MKTHTSVLRATGISLSLAAVIILITTVVRAAAPIRPFPFQGIQIPTDAKSDCRITSSQLAGWFHDHRLETNGIVDPPDSVGFPGTSTSPCPFYTWAHRMFLWITSPAPAYAAGARDFDTQQFFDISPPDSHGNMTLISHVPGRVHFFQVRASKPDSRGLQILQAASGQLLEVQPNQNGPHNLPVVANAAGTQIEVQRVTTAPNGRAVFYDVNDRVIPNPQMIPASPTPTPGPASASRGTPSFPAVVSTPMPVQKFVVAGNLPVYVDGSGNVVPVASGETDAAVLESQGGSLVYYAIMVNDVYAYFLTGQRTAGIVQTHFPSDNSELDLIVQLAAKHHVKINDPGALAVEVKSAWVEASTLPDPGDYITTTASIPTYDKSNPADWVQNGSRTETLALVGMHIVGSVAGHPDMVWSTFEHEKNAPNGSYSYSSKSGVKTVPQRTAGAWVFCCSNPSGPFNQARMTRVGSHIESNMGFTLGPSDTIRWKAWGAASNQAAGLRNTAESNAEVIATNNDVIQMLPNDVRSNYILDGATWTGGSGGPTGDYPSGNVFGTNYLSNTTLETYLQGSNTTNVGGNSCFLCHNATGVNLLAMSHVFYYTKPLFGQALATTPKSLTLTPTHSETLVSWSTPTEVNFNNGLMDYGTDPDQKNCQGWVQGETALGYPATQFFQDADQTFGMAFTGFFPFLQTETQNTGWVGIQGVFAGSEAIVLTATYNNPGVVVCTLPVTSTVSAVGGISFDLNKLASLKIYSATLTLNALQTLVCCPGYNPPPTAGPSQGSYGGSSTYKKKVRIRLLRSNSANTPASISSGGWCATSVYEAATKWWETYPLNLTYNNSNRLANLGGPQGVDVTSLVSHWISQKHTGDHGFILVTDIGVPPGGANFACVTKLNATLKIVYI